MRFRSRIVSMAIVFVIPLTTKINVAQDLSKTFIIDKRYINFPIQMSQERQKMNFIADKDTLTYSLIRLADDSTDYWIFSDFSRYQGHKIAIHFSRSVSGIDKVYQSDFIAGHDSLYQEKYRPQFHFTSKRGWNNDPNGLVYHEGEYHLFYQHNPYEIYWQNMHWGHAVSRDLIHWEELPDALYPDKLGTMFSGSAVIDKVNSSGWGKDVLVAAYTAAAKDKQTQCLAYSRDKGRSFIKYNKNPVIDSKDKWNTSNTRDPKVFWYEPGKKWIMVLFEANGNSIYTSTNLKEWHYQSHIIGFWECPELFQLAVDGNPEYKKWVMYGASGTYMIGDFDGEKFQPQAGKYRTFYGSIYAAQTYNNVPDNRRIQIGWGRIEQLGMPFNQMMLFPTELTLRSTKEGIRLYGEPIKEIIKLHKNEYSWKDLSLDRANEKLKNIKSDLLHLKASIELPKGIWFTIYYHGNWIVTFDGSYDMMNKVQFIQDEPGRYIFDLELLIDRTSVEAFFENGKMVVISPLQKPKDQEGLVIKADGNQLQVRNLEVYELKSIWEDFYPSSDHPFR